MNALRPLEDEGLFYLSKFLYEVSYPDKIKGETDHGTVSRMRSSSFFTGTEHIAKPQHYIRAFVVGQRTVCATNRTSEHWVTKIPTHDLRYVLLQ